MKYCYCLFFILLGLGSEVNAQSVNRASFFQKQEMRWDSLGSDYYSGMLLGNGLLGANIYKTGQNTLRFDIGRTDVVDNREQELPGISKLYTQARLPVGAFQLKTRGHILASGGTLDIYRAKAIGILRTDLGTVSFSAYVSAVSDAIVIDLKITGKEPVPELVFVPAPSISTRMAFNTADKPADFPANPPVAAGRDHQFSVFHQRLTYGGGYATVFQSRKTTTANAYVISMGYDGNGNEDEVAMAKANIRAFRQHPDAFNRFLHEQWWRNYYDRSFVALPDKRMESFYWAQLYKLGCLTRPGKPMIDLVGPWTYPTPWTAIWWNLNVQLTYSAMFATNHTDLCEPLFKALETNAQNLILNAPPEWRADAAYIGRSSSYNLVSPVTDKQIASGDFETANLTWTLFYYDLYCRYNADSATYRNVVFPLLKRSTAFLIHLLKKDSAGVYHMPVSISPEYSHKAADANYALSSLRWALTTLLDTTRSQPAANADAHRYREILAHLSPYPQDSTGFMIGRDVSLSVSHRHYSHLLMLYPYHLLNWENEADRTVIEKSLRHWISLRGALQGYTFTGASSIYAGMGRGDEACRMLNELFDKYIQANTLYKESGPVIETPLSAVTSITDMLLQSWGGKIRIFPAIPAAWSNAAFNKLLAEGKFEVSAKREHGVTAYVRLVSKAGGICVVQTAAAPYKIYVNGKRQPLVRSSVVGDQIVSLPTRTGDIVELVLPGTSRTIKAVPYQQHENWFWGRNRH